jgi:NAD(P)-dependent dehydrogenase (short-subunit alcohol dehydrogenase family)
MKNVLITGGARGLGKELIKRRLKPSIPYVVFERE